jgi:hypothetical protein
VPDTLSTLTAPATTGPWDSTELPDLEATPGHAPRHGLDTVVDAVSAHIEVPREFAADVRLSSADGDVPDTMLFTTADGVTCAVSVLAEPVGESRWETGLAEQTVATLTGDTPAPVTQVAGPLGTEVHVTDAGTLRFARLGADGPRWTALVTVFGDIVAEHHLDAARTLLASMVVFRGRAACGPDTPLSMQLVRP